MSNNSMIKGLLQKYDRLFIALLGVAIGSIFTFSYFELQKEVESEVLEKRQGAMGLINPILDCITPAAYGLKSFEFENDLKVFVKKLINPKHGVAGISLYFKDLSNGPVMGIDEDRPILGGSLLKVPLMIGLFKAIEEDKSILDQKIKIANHGMTDLYHVQGIEPVSKLKMGETYTVGELIEAAIIYSDNVAAYSLESFHNNYFLKKTVSDLNIPISSRVAPFRDMSIKDYSGFFRILYNASYLGQQFSNRALELLTRTHFVDGMRKGVPQNIKLAHKFGESLEKNGTLYFNECGIVYHPKRPYLLCISSQGSDETKQMKVIQKISKYVFKRVEEL